MAKCNRLLYFLVTLYQLTEVFKLVSAIDWNKVKPMYLVAMHPKPTNSAMHDANDDEPLVLNLETDPMPENDITKEAMNRIFGGSEADFASFPYQIGFLLQRPKGLYWCGGSLISHEYVLTAAHCVDMASRALVFLGAHDIKDPHEPGQIRMMVYHRDFYIFPTWNPRKLKDDIAIVRLPRSVSYNERIQPIQLPKRDYEYRTFEDKLGVASGWGRYATGVHAISNVLRYVQLRIVNGRTCKNNFPLSYRSTNICTSGRYQKSTCNGDSGGPLVLQRRTSRKRVLVGITSFGSIFGCDRGYPAAFTKVASYLDWIVDITGIDPSLDVADAIRLQKRPKDHYYYGGKTKYTTTKQKKPTRLPTPSVEDEDSFDIEDESEEIGVINTSNRKYPDAELFSMHLSQKKFTRSSTMPKNSTKKKTKNK
ncbi:brachyurin-like isoform X1 [Musca autumnalis]|uniref:brachyurin-like isoform X1 n=1 Tax=Musca autumnalis TaxID=221902 RepID=UPI003CF31181